MLYRKIYTYFKNKIYIISTHPFLKVKLKDYLVLVIFIIILILIFTNKLPLIKILKDL